MSDLNRPEDVATYNQRSLKTLARAIALSGGQFSPILVRCNYSWLQQRLLEQLREICAVEWRELILPESVTTLYTTIESELGSQTPEALMVFGLESVKAIDALLTSTNQVREEFRKRFPFPIVLWIDDIVLQKLIWCAPDFKSWAATSIKFEISTLELTEFLRYKADLMFQGILNNVSTDRFLTNGALNLAMGSRHRQVIELAQNDLQNRQFQLDGELDASLKFLLGRDEYASDRLDTAIEYYRHSLRFWQQPPDERSGKLQRHFDARSGVLLFHIGLCYTRLADLEPARSRSYWERAKSYFQECLEAFSSAKRQDLVAKFIGQLGQVLRRLEAWDELDRLAKQALQLHQTLAQINKMPLKVHLAQDYGFLAEVALKQYRWLYARQLAERALKLLGESPTPQPQHQALYLLLLARSQRHLNKPDEAIAHLERAREIKVQGSAPLHQHDPQLYVRILQDLRSLYFEKKRYLDAFWLEREQLSIENQYGFRAFMGAGQLVAQRQTINPARERNAIETSVPDLTTLAQTAAGRQRDIQGLLDRISRSDCKLTAIHGHSGVGKSSIINAGLVPALRSRAIGDRVPLPVVLPVYVDWAGELERRLDEAVRAWQREEEDEGNIDRSRSPVETILARLRRNNQRNLLTILIFDQFEEFFVVCKSHRDRQEFYNFLRDCLNLPFVKVILSLREDYLHFLLECQRHTDLDAVNHNILDKDILYYLGNFSPEEAKAVVRNLTRRSQFDLEPELVEELIADLSQEFGQVRPIELQVVGEQLQEEGITTLAQYWRLGSHPKAKLVERSLDRVIHNCGPENTEAAWKVLYAFVDEKGSRPLKTKAELATAIARSDDVSKPTSLLPNPQLDLILEILVGSGLVFRHREEFEDRYQLVHDYLVVRIRQKHHEEFAGLKAQLQQAEVSLETRNRRLKQLLGVTCSFALLLLAATVAAGMFWRRAEFQKHLVEVTARSATAEALLLSDKKFDALIESLRTWQQWSRLGQTDVETKLRVVTSIQQALYRVRERNRLEGHGDSVWDVSFSPDGELIASGSTDTTVKLWQSDGTPVETETPLEHQDSVTSVDFSPDGQLIASASSDTTVKLWSRDGQAIKTLNGHAKRVNSVTFDPKGKLIASTSDDNTVRLWTRAGKPVKTLKGHTDASIWVAFSPDGQRLASTSADQTVRLWKRDGSAIATLKGHTGKVNNVAFSPDGRFLASVGDDKTIRIWDRNGTLVQTLTGEHENWIYSVSFSADGRLLASASDDKTIKLWERQDTSTAEFSLVQTLKGHSDGVTQVNFQPQGKLLASSSWDKTIRLWDLEGMLPSRTLNGEIGHRDRVESVSFSPDGRLIATASKDATVKLWRSDGTLVKTLSDHRDRVHDIAFSPDGQLLASASRDCTIKLWTREGVVLQTLVDPTATDESGEESQCSDPLSHGDRVYDVAFSPDGAQLASASRDGMVKLWSREGNLLEILDGHGDRVNSVAFGPDGKILASASDDKTVKLWSRQGRLLHTLPEAQHQAQGHNSYVTSVTFSPDGRTIASAGWDNTVKLWRRNGTFVTTLLKEYSDSLNSVRFSPDGTMLASASWDGTVKLWTLDGTFVKALQGHQSGVIDLAFSPDGKVLASSSDDNTVILWNLDLGDLLALSCDWVDDYLDTNPYLSQRDRQLCQGIDARSPSTDARFFLYLPHLRH